MNSLISRSDAVSLDVLRHFLRDRYGLACTLETLAGEKDQLVRVTAENGALYLLKAANQAETPAEAALQVNVLLHLERRAPSIPAQRVLRTVAGEAWVRACLPGVEGERNIRLFTYLPGILLKQARGGEAQATALGRTWARLGEALRDLDDPGAQHLSRWDMARLAELTPWVGDMTDGAKREMARAAFARFERRVAPALRTLRSQPIHNDFSGDNILVGEAAPDQATGILDFGDMVHSHLINDVAVAATEFLMHSSSDLAPSLAFVRGYAAEVPLTDQEGALLFDLIVSRLVMRVTIAEWRAKRFPENRTYILRNTPSVWQQLERLLAMDRDRATSIFAQAAAGARTP